MFDLKRINERYIIIRNEAQPAPADVEDLRELEGDFGNGVYALWSDELQSIVAWAFEKALYEQAEAEAMVDKMMKEPTGASVLEMFKAVTGAVAQALAASIGLDGPTVTVDPDADPVRDAEPVGAESADADEESAADTDERDANHPVTLMAFTTKLQSGEEAEPDEDDGLLWKEIIHPGAWFKMDTGRMLQVTADMIQAAYRAFSDGLPKRIQVPSDLHWPTVPADRNRGFVRQLKLIGDRLFGGFEFTNPETKRAVKNGDVEDCSVYLQPNVFHPETGDEYEWALTHVLLTNEPLVQDLAPFGAVPASASGVVTVDHYVQKDQDEEEVMSDNQDITLSAEDQTLIEKAKGLGLTAADIEAMVEERGRVTKRERDLEVTSVVRALEGKEEHELVVQAEGTRHWPAVIAAAERALREQPEALAMSVEDGRTELDAVVLGVVNAIPADGRMAIDPQPAGPKKHEDPTLEEPDSDEVKDRKAQALSSMLSPRKGSAVGIK